MPRQSQQPNISQHVGRVASLGCFKAKDSVDYLVRNWKTSVPAIVSEGRTRDMGEAFRLASTLQDIALTQGDEAADLVFDSVIPLVGNPEGNDGPFAYQVLNETLINAPKPLFDRLCARFEAVSTNTNPYFEGDRLGITSFARTFRDDKVINKASIDHLRSEEPHPRWAAANTLAFQLESFFQEGTPELAAELAVSASQNMVYALNQAGSIDDPYSFGSIARFFQTLGQHGSPELISDVIAQVAQVGDGNPDLMGSSIESVVRLIPEGIKKRDSNPLDLGSLLVDRLTSSDGASNTVASCILNLQDKSVNELILAADPTDQTRFLACAELLSCIGAPACAAVSMLFEGEDVAGKLNSLALMAFMMTKKDPEIDDEIRKFWRQSQDKVEAALGSDNEHLRHQAEVFRGAVHLLGDSEEQ